MKKEEYAEIKRAFGEIELKLKDDSLSSDERARLESKKAQLAGALFIPWLPMDWGRRILMGLLLVTGIEGMYLGNSYLAVLLMIALFFSPRIAGKLIHLVARLGKR